MHGLETIIKLNEDAVKKHNLVKQLDEVEKLIKAANAAVVNSLQPVLVAQCQVELARLVNKKQSIEEELRQF